MYIKYTLYLLLLSVYAELCFSQTGFNPETEIEIDLVINNTTGLWKDDGAIQVIVKKGTSPFNYYISTKPAPTSAEDFLIIAENKYLSEFSFENLGKGTYYVFVRDSKMKTQCLEAILLNKNKTIQE